MSLPLLIALLTLAVIGTGLFCVGVGIYNRMGVLIGTISELRSLAVGSQGEIKRTKEEVSKAHAELVRVVDNTRVASQLARTARGLPQR